MRPGPVMQVAAVLTPASPAGSLFPEGWHACRKTVISIIPILQSSRSLTTSLHFVLSLFPLVQTDSLSPDVTPCLFLASAEVAD